MDKARLVVVLEKGLVQTIWISPRLLESTQVIIQDRDVFDGADSPAIAPDPQGRRCYWQLWDEEDFAPLPDDLYAHLDQIFKP